MNKYRAKFYGRRAGAIGQCEWIQTTVNGEDVEQAELNLYDRFEHILDLGFELIEESYER